MTIFMIFFREAGDNRTFKKISIYTLITDYFSRSGDIRSVIQWYQRYTRSMKFPRNSSLFAITRTKIASSDRNISFR